MYQLQQVPYVMHNKYGLHFFNVSYIGCLRTTVVTVLYDVNPIHAKRVQRYETRF